MKIWDSVYTWIDSSQGHSKSDRRSGEKSMLSIISIIHFLRPSLTKPIHKNTKKKQFKQWFPFSWLIILFKWKSPVLQSLDLFRTGLVVCSLLFSPYFWHMLLCFLADVNNNRDPCQVSSNAYLHFRLTTCHIRP